MVAPRQRGEPLAGDPLGLLPAPRPIAHQRDRGRVAPGYGELRRGVGRWCASFTAMWPGFVASAIGPMTTRLSARQTTCGTLSRGVGPMLGLLGAVWAGAVRHRALSQLRPHAVRRLPANAHRADLPPLPAPVSRDRTRRRWRPGPVEDGRPDRPVRPVAHRDPLCSESMACNWKCAASITVWMTC